MLFHLWNNSITAKEEVLHHPRQYARALESHSDQHNTLGNRLPHTQYKAILLSGKFSIY